MAAPTPAAVTPQVTGTAGPVVQKSSARATAQPVVAPVTRQVEADLLLTGPTTFTDAQVAELRGPDDLASSCPSTFAALGVDGHVELLCASGAGRGGQILYDAIFAYNHADWYVTKSLSRAEAGGPVG